MLDKKWEQSAAVYQLFIDFIKAYNLFSREVSYSILTESGITMKLFRLIKIWLSGIYSQVKRGKYWPDTVPSQNVPKQGDNLLSLAVRHVCKIVKFVMSVSPSIYPHGTTQLPLDRFS
jgi:hypothetical protein